MSTNPYWPLVGPDSLGGLVGADDVRDNVKSIIDLWAPYYTAIVSNRLAAQGRIGGPGQNPVPLPEFGTWANDPEHRSFGTGQPAAYLVTSPGTVGQPDLQGNHQYIAVWRAQVMVQVFGTDWQSTADLTSWYEKIVRWCVMQHRSLGGFAMGTSWVGAQYIGKEHTSTRTEGVVTLGFDVKVGNVLDIGAGPEFPPAGPAAPPDDTTVAEVITTLTKVPVIEPLEDA